MIGAKIAKHQLQPRLVNLKERQTETVTILQQRPSDVVQDYALGRAASRDWLRKHE
jgi:hypothetical protein